MTFSNFAFPALEARFDWEHFSSPRRQRRRSCISIVSGISASAGKGDDTDFSLLEGLAVLYKVQKSPTPSPKLLSYCAMGKSLFMNSIITV